MSFFKNLFNKKAETDQPKKGLDTPIEQIQKERDGYISLGKSIFPVIKAVEDPNIIRSINNNPIIKEPIAEGIVKCYVLDLGDRFEYIAKSHLEQFGLEIKDIDEAAIRNLTERFNENSGIGEIDLSEDVPEAKPFYKVDMDANFPPSMMLVDEFWEKIVPNVVQTNIIAVSIPAKNLLFFSDFKTMESFRTMKAFGGHMYNASIQDNIPITQNVYLRVKGKWILFTDTDEQLEELYDELV